MKATTTTQRDTNVMGKVARRLLPLLFALYVINFLDRANIGVAALSMNAELGLSATAYGTASGIFFIGYVLFQVPANAALQRFGARRWIAVVVLAWGVCSAAGAFVTDVGSLYLVRFVLGVAEAGFFPGVIAYLAIWFPARQRAQAIAAFLMAIPASNIFGLPLSGLLVEYGGVAGWPGWRTMFLVEAIPAVLLGLVVWRRGLLPDGPSDAPWLTEAERTDLARRLADDATTSDAKGAVRRGHLVVFAAVYAGLYFALYALQFFLPQIVASVSPGGGALSLSVLSALPYTAAGVAMLTWSRICDRSGARPTHIAWPALTAVLAASCAAFATGSRALLLVCVAAAVAGIFAAVPAFWSQCTTYLNGPRAAIAVAGVNAAASLASFAGPYATGHIRDASGSYRLALLAVGGALALTSACTLLMPGRRRRRDSASENASRGPREPV